MKDAACRVLEVVLVVVAVAQGFTGMTKTAFG